jgi:hypothetical protein
MDIGTGEIKHRNEYVNICSIESGWFLMLTSSRRFEKLKDGTEDISIFCVGSPSSYCQIVTLKFEIFTATS